MIIGVVGKAKTGAGSNLGGSGKINVVSSSLEGMRKQNTRRQSLINGISTNQYKANINTLERGLVRDLLL